MVSHVVEFEIIALPSLLKCGLQVKVKVTLPVYGLLIHAYSCSAKSVTSDLYIAFSKFTDYQLSYDWIK
jgi:hypothetical protein